MKNMKIVIAILFLLIIYMYVSNISLIPEQITLLEGESYKIRTLFGVDVVETSSTVAANESTVKIDLNLLSEEILNGLPDEAVERMEKLMEDGEKHTAEVKAILKEYGVDMDKIVNEKLAEGEENE